MSVVTRIRTAERLTVPFTPAEVFGVLMAAGAYPQWWPFGWPVRVLCEQPGLLGTELEVRPRLGHAFRFRFVELTEPSVIRFRLHTGVIEGPGVFTIEPTESGTRVHCDVDVFVRGFGVAMSTYVVPFDRLVRLRMRSLLKSLARRLQRQGEAAKRAREA